MYVKTYRSQITNRDMARGLKKEFLKFLLAMLILAPFAFLFVWGMVRASDQAQENWCATYKSDYYCK